MTINLHQLAIVLCWAICAIGFAYYAATIAREITYVTLADGRKTERKIPLLMRLLLPFVQNLSGLVRAKALDKARGQAEWMLIAAGMEGLLTANEFLALKYLMPLVCGGFWTLFILAMGALMPDSVFSENVLPLSLMGIFWFYIYPLSWLRRSLKKRHLSIMRALPFVLDLLTLSVEAGMDFMSALDDLARERNINKEKLIEKIEAALVSAYKKEYGNITYRIRIKRYDDSEFYCPATSSDPYEDESNYKDESGTFISCSTILQFKRK